MRNIVKTIRDIVFQFGMDGTEPGVKFEEEGLIRVLNMEQARVISFYDKKEDQDVRAALHYLKLYSDDRVVCVMSNHLTGKSYGLELSYFNNIELENILEALSSRDIKNYYLKRNYLILRLYEILFQYGTENMKPQVCLREVYDLVLDKPVKMTITLAGEKRKVSLIDAQRYRDANYLSLVFLNFGFVLENGNEIYLNADRISLADLKKIRRNLENYIKRTK